MTTINKILMLLLVALSPHSLYAETSLPATPPDKLTSSVTEGTPITYSGTESAAAVESNVLTIQSSEYFTLNQITLKNGELLQEEVIHGPPTPPVGYELERQSASLPIPNTAAGINTLTVPGYNWVFGCSAVSGAMIAAFHDRNGYPNIYTGSTNEGIMPLNNSSWPTWSDGDNTYPSCPLIASKNGVDGRTSKGSIDDYWIKYNSNAADPYITNGRTQHTWGDAIGDYMKTGQSAYSNPDGSTSFWGYTASASKLTCATMSANNLPDGTLGRKAFYEAKGYTVTDCYNQSTDNQYPGGFSFVNYKSEIDAGNPVMLNLAGHTVVGVGYDDSTQTVYLHDTWDYTDHQMTWGTSYAGMTLQSVSIVHLTGAEPDTTPDAFSFTDQTNIAPSTVVESNVITVSGINAPTTIKLYGYIDSNSEYSINGGSYTNNDGVVSNGQTVRVRHTSSADYGTMVRTSINIGGTAAPDGGGVWGSFTSTTMSDTTPDPFTFTDQTGVALSTMVESNPIIVSGINVAVDFYVDGAEYSINGGDYTNAQAMIINGTSIRVRHISSANYATATDTRLYIGSGGIFDTFTSTTLPSPVITHTLNVNKTGTGAGTVTSVPAGINCGTDCYATYPDNTSVTLTATADAGSQFIGWAGDCSTSTGSTCTLNIAATRYATAHFMPITHTLNVTKTGTGLGTVTSKPAGINCGTDCTETYATSGTVVKLTAVVGTNSLFTGWSGACSGTSTTCSVTVTNLQNVTANFNYITYNLTTNKVGNGTISSSPAGIDCGTDCTEAVNKGSTITLTATPDTGYKLISWTGCTSTTTSCTVSMTAAKTVTATFKPVFPLSVSKTGTGSGTVKATGINCDTRETADCNETYLKDTSVSLTATATTGSRFTGWSGACTGSTTCKVAMNDAKNVTANFDIITYKLAVAKVGNGTVNSVPAGITCGDDCTEDYLPKTSVTLTVIAATGYKFTGWTGCTSTTTSCTVSMTAAKTVTATFKPVFPLSVSKTGTGSGIVKATGINCDTTATADCNETYLKDTNVSLTATATTGSRFAGWSGACIGSTTCKVAMNDAKNVTANFDIITYKLAVAKVGNGTVNSVPAGITCGDDCTEDYLPKTSVTLTIIAATGYKFTGWTGCTSTTTSCTVSMTAAKTVTATFKPVFTFNVSNTGTGAGKVTGTGINCDGSSTQDCTEDYLKDTKVSLKATAAVNSRFTVWSGACTGTTCTVTMNEAKNVSANFNLK